MFFGHFFKDVTFQLSKDTKRIRGRPPLFLHLTFVWESKPYILFYFHGNRNFHVLCVDSSKDIVGLHFIKFNIVMMLFIVNWGKTKKNSMLLSFMPGLHTLFFPTADILL